ncbi:hypothetical protein SO3561_08947 [Streptomyces olivochromogenes]|uniref:Uncharacterized protein n=1 Tax=Streptomyces olivochromogenes TaxID=1963 RepID=A0A250VT43_STROL|nr:hypothetical protein SO3561_08947 [Streptomyces olivochromogenes]
MPSGPAPATVTDRWPAVEQQDLGHWSAGDTWLKHESWGCSWGSQGLHRRDAAKEVLFRLMHPESTIGRRRVRHPSSPLGRRGVPGLDHARPPTHTRLRTARPALRIAGHPGRHHTHDQANHPPKLPQERTVGIPRSRPGLIILKVRAITLALTRPESPPEPARLLGAIGSIRAVGDARCLLWVTQRAVRPQSSAWSVSAGSRPTPSDGVLASTADSAVRRGCPDGDCADADRACLRGGVGSSWQEEPTSGDVPGVIPCAGLPGASSAAAAAG